MQHNSTVIEELDDADYNGGVKKVPMQIKSVQSIAVDPSNKSYSICTFIKIFLPVPKIEFVLHINSQLSCFFTARLKQYSTN